MYTLLYAIGPNGMTNENSSATPTTQTTPSSPHKADYTKSNTRSKPSSRAQRRSACALKRMPFSSLSRCVTTVSSPVHSLTRRRRLSPAHLALERGAGLLSAKDVPHRRPRRHRDRRPDIRCACPQVRLTHFSHTIKARREKRRRKRRPALFLTAPCSNFMRQQAMSSKMVFNRPVPVNRLVSAIADSTSCPSLPAAKLTSRIRGSGEYAGIRPASVRRRLPCHRAGPHRPTPIRVLAERHLLRIFRRLDRRTQPECQDLPREALRVLCRLYVSPSFLTLGYTYICTRVH
jgi:hypothetical protein